jgi:cellulose biosynthesis protein BcsQ
VQHLTKDIADLCATAGLDTECYQVFSAPPFQAHGEAAPSVEAPVTDIGESAGPAFGNSRLVQSAVAGHNAGRGSVGQNSPHQWNGLRQAFGAARPALAHRTGTSRLVVVSAAGGAGGTTVSATVARILSVSEHVALTEATEQQLLPYHFGVAQAGVGGCMLLPERPGERGAVHLFGMPQTASAARFDWVREKTTAIEGDYNRVIVDAGSASGVETTPASSLVLIVATPDMNTAVRLSSLVPLLAARGAQFKVLLNKFDGAQSLHMAFLTQLQERFADVLLPLRIRYSPLAPEALAEGQTVIDYAPGTPIAEEFLHLATWLTTHRGVPVP